MVGAGALGGDTSGNTGPTSGFKPLGSSFGWSGSSFGRSGSLSSTVGATGGFKSSIAGSICCGEGSSKSDSSGASNSPTSALVAGEFESWISDSTGMS